MVRFGLDGDVIGEAADGVGGLLVKAFLAPFKTTFGGSCEDVCSRPWDFVCFIEHLCVSNLLELLMILVLCYITGVIPMHWKKPLKDPRRVRLARKHSRSHVLEHHYKVVITHHSSFFLYVGCSLVIVLFL
ncbi:hypothetical protein L3X38_042747 [Prunus dulcis]|uniref:Uncharacterized protein n=1 Tax=Prunus dulcis TaxID=3755 RepID=A0AAD4UWV1_PRUDU|nr:hypothetical protein L3X38_042747 [Prunus dulcis]